MATVRPMTDAEREMRDDLDWALNAPEVQQNKGQFVAICNRHVYAVGHDPQALRADAAAQAECPIWRVVLVSVQADELLEASD